ncbi:unnamed protein product, partial [Aphanomyces euteiches]
MKSLRAAVEDLKVSAASAVKRYKYCRETYTKEMEMGGASSKVEIDETSLKKKSKYGRGTQHEDRCLFGGVETSTNKWFGVLTSNDRAKETLSRIIANHLSE